MKALFWDFDGTLSYPNKSFNTALYEAMCSEGYTTDKAEAEDFLNKTYSWKTPDFVYTDKTGEMWWDSLFDKISEFLSEKNIGSDASEKICKRFRELLTDVGNYELYDDTKKTLQKCMDMGYKNYLVTNNYPEITDNLQKLGLAEYFEECIVSSHIGYEKPREEFFDYAKKKAKNPEKGIMIGDNPKADIQGGRNAGFLTIAVHELKTSSADYYVEKLADITALI